MKGWKTLFDPKDTIPSLEHRVVIYGRDPRPKRKLYIRSRHDLESLMRPAASLDREGVWLFALASDDSLVGVMLLGLGGTSYAYVDGLALSRTLLICGAPRFALIHNHPSGWGDASSEDHRLTETSVAAAEVFGFRLTHSIVSRRHGCTSAARGGASSKESALFPNPADSLMPNRLARYELRSAIEGSSCDLTRLNGDADSVAELHRIDARETETVVFAMNTVNEAVGTLRLPDDPNRSVVLPTLAFCAASGGASFVILPSRLVDSSMGRHELEQAAATVGLRMLSWIDPQAR